MEFLLERELCLLTEVEHNNLYKWAIIERDESRKHVCGNHQIPWQFGLYFTATEVALSDETTITEAREEATISHRTTIHVRLRPGHPEDDDNRSKRTTYRMFGTDRVIDDFRLEISPLGTEEETEVCRSWGSVSYTTEVDFRNETTEDCVVFYMMVKPSTFDRYVSRIASNTAEEIILRFCQVSGFYSEWSPLISKDEVKVLTNNEEQNVQQDNGAIVEVPRLGPVGEVALYINARRHQAH